MKWGKVVLLFQATTTFIIAIILFSQMILIGTSGIKDLNPETNSEELSITSLKFLEIKNRYAIAAYLLFVISFAELIIITRHIR